MLLFVVRNVSCQTCTKGERGRGRNKRRRDAFTRVYVSGAATAASLFESTSKFPLLPSTTGRVEAVDPVRGAGEVGHDVRREACRGSAGNSWGGGTAFDGLS